MRRGLLFGCRRKKKRQKEKEERRLGISETEMEWNTILLINVCMGVGLPIML